MPTSEADLKRDLAFACRILAAEGQGDNIFGHVSARTPGLDRFTDLVKTSEQGRLVAAALGQGTALFLRNHGIVVAHVSVEEAVWAALSLERAAQVQLLAQPSPEAPLLYTPEDEMPVKKASIWSAARARAVFDYYVRRLR